MKDKYLRLVKIANAEKMNLGDLSLNWTFKLKEIDSIVLGIDSFTQLKKT